MTLACDKCGTTDFAAGRAFAMSFICPDCRLIMCRDCAGRAPIGDIPALCCYHCGSTGIRDAEVWADRLTSRCSGPGHADGSS
jgi:hypothetical protein